MQRTRRIAAAATASAVVIAGAITAFTVAASPAKAASVGTCTITAATSSPQSCHIMLNGFSIFPIDNPLTMTLTSTVGTKADVYTVSWTALCFSSLGGSFGQHSGSQTYNDGVGSDPSGTTFQLPLDQQDMSGSPASCDISAKLTATTAVTGTDTETLALDATYQPTPSATSSSASPTPSATPTATHSAPPPGGALTGIIKGFDGKCVDDPRNSSSLRTKVQIWSCNGSGAQKWTYSGGEVKIHGMCLNAKGSGRSGSKVLLWNCDGGANEIWVFNTLDHQVKLKANGFTVCLDDPGYSTRNGTQLMVYTCHNSPNQHWSLP